MSHHIAGPVLFVQFLFSGEDAQGPLLVSVAGADCYRNRVDRDVHHHQQAELHCRVDDADVKCRCPSVSGRGGLENGCENTRAHRERGQFLVVKIKSNNDDYIDYIKGAENTK